MICGQRNISIGIIAILGILVGSLLFTCFDRIPIPVHTVNWSRDAQWIRPLIPSYRLYLRRSFYLANNVKSAWIRLSADNDFKLYVNGKLIGQDSNIYDNSKSFGSELEKINQPFNDSVPYEVKTRPNYLLSNARDWKITNYFDLTHYLQSGKNTIALSIQKGQKNPGVIIEGEVKPVNDIPSIILNSGMDAWKISRMAEHRNQINWYEIEFPDQYWEEEMMLSPVVEETYSRVNPLLYERSLHGSWISADGGNSSKVWLQQNWRIKKNQDTRGYVRISGKSDFSLLINNIFVKKFAFEDTPALHMFDITNLLKDGNNSFLVQLESFDNINLYSKDSPTSSFFMDGWVEGKKSKIISELNTDNHWRVLESSSNAIRSKASLDKWTDTDASNILHFEPVNQSFFSRIYEGDISLLNFNNYLLHYFIHLLIGELIVMFISQTVGLILTKGEKGSWSSINTGISILIPGTFFLIGVYLLKHRYEESERGLLFARQSSDYIILLVFICIIVTSILIRILSSNDRNSYNFMFKGFSFILSCFLIGLVSIYLLSSIFTHNTIHLDDFTLSIIFVFFFSASTLLMIIKTNKFNSLEPIKIILNIVDRKNFGTLIYVCILTLSIILRLFNLGKIGLDWDENVSLDTARGILQTGAPIASSGVWYVRSPFYHYMLALWLYAFGDSIYNAKFLSAIWGVVTLPLTYIFTYRISKQKWISLLIMSLFAVDPYMIWYSQNIRFYQVIQCLTLLTLTMFFKGFIEKEGKIYQSLFFLFLSITLLNQEVTITILPIYLLGFLIFYKPFIIKKDWSILVGALITCGIYACDSIMVYIKGITPWVLLTTDTEAPIKLHLSNVTDFISIFFIAPGRMYILYSFAFFLGIIYFTIKRNGAILFLFSTIVLNLLIITLISTNAASRYVYNIYPIFIILSVFSAIKTIEFIAILLDKYFLNIFNFYAIGQCFFMVLIFGNLELNRVLDGYSNAITVRNDDIFEYIKENRRPGDIIISDAPPSAAINQVKLDYYYLPKSFGNTYWHEGRIVDRGAGAEILNNLDQLNYVFTKNKRVWVHQGLEARYNLEFTPYLDTLGRPVLESFLTELHLWDPDDGNLQRTHNENKDMNNY